MLQLVVVFAGLLAAAFVIYRLLYTGVPEAPTLSPQLKNVQPPKTRTKSKSKERKVKANPNAKRSTFLDDVSDADESLARDAGAVEEPATVVIQDKKSGATARKKPTKGGFVEVRGSKRPSQSPEQRQARAEELKAAEEARLAEKAEEKAAYEERKARREAKEAEKAEKAAAAAAAAEDGEGEEAPSPVKAKAAPSTDVVARAVEETRQRNKKAKEERAAPAAGRIVTKKVDTAATREWAAPVGGAAQEGDLDGEDEEEYPSLA